MERDQLGIDSSAENGRIDCSHPPNDSGVAMSELNGQQLISAEATKRVVTVLLQALPDVRSRTHLGRVTADVTSLDELAEAVRGTYGAKVLMVFQSTILERFGNFNDGSGGYEFQVKEALMQWARSEPGRQQVSSALVKSSASTLVTKRQVRALQDEPVGVRKYWTRTTKSGLPLGPGSYEPGPRKLQRRNGRGRSGKDLSS